MLTERIACRLLDPDGSLLPTTPAYSTHSVSTRPSIDNEEGKQTILFLPFLCHKTKIIVVLECAATFLPTPGGE